MNHPSVFQDDVISLLTLDAIGNLNPSPEQVEEAKSAIRDALYNGLTPDDIRKSLEGLADEISNEHLEDQ